MYLLINDMSNYLDGWRSNDAGGGVSWADSWNSGAYAQQMKSAAKVDNEYLNRFNSLGKSNSSVDDEEGWRTVVSLRNNDSGNVQSIQNQANEWKSKGFDVRVQDLDERHGAKWADLAVRKGPGMDEPVVVEEEELVPATDSPHLKQAKERVNAWEEHSWSGDRAEETFGQGMEKKNYDFSKKEFGVGPDETSKLLANYKSKYSQSARPARSNYDNAERIAMSSNKPSATPIDDFSSLF